MNNKQLIGSVYFNKFFIDEYCIHKKNRFRKIDNFLLSHNIIMKLRMFISMCIDMHTNDSCFEPFAVKRDKITCEKIQ